MNFNQDMSNVLKNFASINPSIEFNSTNVLRTMSPNKTILARATLPNKVGAEFCIYDLSRFLGIVSMFENPEFDVQDKFMTISSNGRRVNYTFADRDVIVLPPNKDIDIGKDVIRVTITNNDLQEIIKALGVLGLPDLAIHSENGEVVLRATDMHNDDSDNYDIRIGESDQDFTAVFKSENIKILPKDYEVSINPRGIAYFDGGDIEYWISLESNSIF